MPSDLQVSNIKDLTGSNTGLSIASDGQITVNQNNPTITLGSNATGFTGIKNIDVWQVDDDLSGNQTPIPYSRWQRSTDATGGANLGTGMTLTDVSSGGVFTFPTTGIWEVYCNFQYVIDSDNRYVFQYVQVANDGTTGTFSDRCENGAFIEHSYGHTYANSQTKVILDVTTSGTSGKAVKFAVTWQNSGNMRGTTGRGESCVYFTRLGDT